MGYQIVPVLSYHSFSWKTSDAMTIREIDFEAQMKYLKTNGYHVVSLSQMLDLFNGRELPKKSVVITLDDGWGSQYRIAYPILRKYGYPYTLFIQTDLINSVEKTLDWDQIREMLKNSDLSIGAHTQSHRDLTRPNRGELFTKYFSSIEQELSLAKKIIFRETGEDPTHLSYPYGKTNQLVIDYAKDLGYDAGFTVFREPNSVLTNPLKLNRSMIYGTYNLEQFENQLITFKYFDSKSERSNDEISMSQPTETTARLLEKKGYWLKALNYWRLIQDSLLQNANLEYSQATRQKPQASDSKAVILNGNYEKRIVIAENNIEQLENRIQVLANEHYEKGISYFSTRKPSKGKREMLKALYFNPKSQKAQEKLSQEINKLEYQIVKVRDGDTSKTIAKRTYKQASIFPLVTYYADKQGGLIPGVDLRLPRLKIKIKKKSEPISLRQKPSKDNIGKDCGIKLIKPKVELSKIFFEKGGEYFTKDQVLKAIQSLETSVCLDPENDSAVELLQLLNSINN